MKEAHETKQEQNLNVPEAMKPFLVDLEEFMLEELLLMRDIQHLIELIPRANLTNLQYYRMTLRNKVMVGGILRTEIIF